MDTHVDIDVDIDFDSIARQFFVNADEIVESRRRARALPRLYLKNGLVIDHGVEDPVASLFHEIFVTKDYIRGHYAPRPGDHVIDCGANIGVFALFLAASTSDIKVFRFEPSAGTRARLFDNVRLNRLESQVTVFPFAVTDYDGPVCLKRVRSSGDTSMFSRPENIDGPTESADGLSLESAVRLCRVHAVDMLKLDVEGAEVEILRGARHLNWTRLRQVVVEYHDMFRSGCRNAVRRMLTEYGFPSIIEHGTDDFRQGILYAARTDV